jgi:hypothetical protein
MGRPSSSRLTRAASECNARTQLPAPRSYGDSIALRGIIDLPEVRGSQAIAWAVKARMIKGVHPV